MPINPLSDNFLSPPLSQIPLAGAGGDKGEGAR